jgi:hypothetical protein
MHASVFALTIGPPLPTFLALPQAVLFLVGKDICGGYSFDYFEL